MVRESHYVDDERSPADKGWEESSPKQHCLDPLFTCTCIHANTYTTVQQEIFVGFYLSPKTKLTHENRQ